LIKLQRLSKIYLFLKKPTQSISATADDHASKICTSRR